MSINHSIKASDHKAQQMFSNKNVFQPSMSCTNLKVCRGEYWGKHFEIKLQVFLSLGIIVKTLYFLGYYLIDKSQLYFILY